MSTKSNILKDHLTVYYLCIIILLCAVMFSPYLSDGIHLIFYWIVAMLTPSLVSKDSKVYTKYLALISISIAGGLFFSTSLIYYIQQSGVFNFIFMLVLLSFIYIFFIRLHVRNLVKLSSKIIVFFIWSVSVLTCINLFIPITSLIQLVLLAVGLVYFNAHLVTQIEAIEDGEITYNQIPLQIDRLLISSFIVYLIVFYI